MGPLTEGQQATATACLNGTTQCATFTVLGARPEYATLEAVSGTGQSVSISGTPAQIVMRVRDMDGNPMAGGMVTLYQALYAWAPPCPPHGRCAQQELLGYQTATRYLRPGRHRQLYAGGNSRRGYQYSWHRRHRQRQHADRGH